MCGIYGSLGFIDVALLSRMKHLLSHRGKDEEGFYSDSNVYMGHLRLSIIDLNTGRQPVFNEDKTIVTVFNGEIYDHAEIKKNLMARGHRFYSESDTEVIVHAYEEWGFDFPNHLNGMFAIALYDIRKKNFLLLRDRIGIKPLYYSLSESGRILFASEFKAIFQAHNKEAQMDPSVLSKYLSFKYIPCPDTLVENIKKMVPGEIAIKEANKPLRFKKFWELKVDKTLKISEIEAAEETRRLLNKSVKRRLRADVKVGVMLSGGIDSSAIAFLAAQNSKKLQTFTIGFKNEPDNEFEFAREVAEKIASEHLEFLVKPADLSILPEIIWYNDEPVAGPSSLATYLMVKEIRDKATVLLFGHGADELFHGYEYLKALKLLNLLKAEKITAFSKFFPDKNFCRGSILGRLFSFINSMKKPAENYFNLISIFNLEEQKLLLKKEVRIPVLPENLFPPFSKTPDFFSAIQYFEMKDWLSEDLLFRIDRMTMAHTTEGRVPFLDHELVEFALQLPFSYNLKGFREKSILKNGFKNDLPGVIINRPKQRFIVPMDHFYEENLIKLASRLFSEKNELNENFLNKKFLLELLNRVKSPSQKYFLSKNKIGAQFYLRQIYTLITIQLWYKLYFENKSISQVKERWFK